MKEYLQKVTKGQDLSRKEASNVMEIIMSMNAEHIQVAGLLSALRTKGESVEEITGFAEVMRKKAEQISPKASFSVDTCGTGGDSLHTFNISTAVALVVASGGVTVSKHGNRSVSSKSGSADVFEKLGVNITLTPLQVEQCMNEIGIGFMFAPSFHQSMKFVAPVRKTLGVRTVFNILGPLTNPAGAKGQLLGVFDKETAEKMAKVLFNLGVKRAMVVHGLDGLDEITIQDDTLVYEIKDNEIKEYVLDPEQYDIRKRSLSDIQVENAEESRDMILEVLKGKTGAHRDIVLLNAAACFYISEKVNSLSDGMMLAGDLIDSGKAMAKLNQMVSYTNEVTEKSSCIY
ncbi:MAG: anthranilate phosphoribosyltransferase [Clostridia bacterium]|nr:anthranilate phosphoribosyltransferase [Clostridia bacterium]